MSAQSIETLIAVKKNGKPIGRDELIIGDVVELVFPDGEETIAKTVLMIENDRATCYGPHRQFGCFLELNQQHNRWVGTRLFREIQQPQFVHHVVVDPSANMKHHGTEQPVNDPAGAPANQPGAEASTT